MVVIGDEEAWLHILQYGHEAGARQSEIKQYSCAFVPSIRPSAQMTCLYSHDRDYTLLSPQALYAVTTCGPWWRHRDRVGEYPALTPALVDLSVDAYAGVQNVFAVPRHL